MARPAKTPTLCLITGVLFLSLAALLLHPSRALAQSRNTENTLKLDNPADRLAAKVNSLAWLSGYWRGESSIGIAEETWMPPSHGTMVGAFKVVRENQPYFYEFVEISEEEGSLTLKVKHFSAELHGWEEKDNYVSFPLVKLGHHEAYFGGLTYRRTRDTELRVYVAVKQEDGRLEEIEFVFQLQANSNASPVTQGSPE